MQFSEIRFLPDKNWAIHVDYVSKKKNNALSFRGKEIHICMATYGAPQLVTSD